MRYTFVGRNITIRDNLKEKTMQKINRLERILPNDADITVTFSQGKINETAEVTVPIHKRILRAEASAKDFESAIDDVVAGLEKQMLKYKARLQQKSRSNHAFREEFGYVSPNLGEPESDLPEINIKKTKRFALKPMDAEEAVMEMELLGHSFYVFSNSQNDEVNVVYKRSDGAYGLIEPEY